METITLADLAPILAAVIGPMLVFAAATMRYQHLDSTKTRELIDKNRELSEQAHKETRELIDKNRERSEQSLGEIRDLIDRNHRELSGSLGDARERLSRMEGYMRASSPPPHEIGDGDAEAA